MPGKIQRQKWVEEYNNSLPQEIHYDSDGEEFSVAIGGIYDSEYMNYVCDNIASKRIKMLRKKCDISVTMISGVICRKCNTALEPHLMIEHLDINHCVHKCENGHKRK